MYVHKDVYDPLGGIETMKKIFFLVAAIPLQLVSCLGYGQFGGPESFDLVEFDTTEILNRDTITFTVDKLATGNHTLEIYFVPVDDADFEQPYPPPTTFTYRVEMKRGRKIKEKTYSHILRWDILRWQMNRSGYFLFNVPKDFFWSSKGNLQITIKDISFSDTTFTQYYKTVRLYIKRHSLVFEHKNETVGY
ncbi:hypothetical protein FACS189491_05560 [Spirochaetia bacterium]|nr:hypothetical protein FACS189491_05560 [Spirochaetia bacterium]